VTETWGSGRFRIKWTVGGEGKVSCLAQKKMKRKESRTSSEKRTKPKGLEKPALHQKRELSKTFSTKKEKTPRGLQKNKKPNVKKINPSYSGEGPAERESATEKKAWKAPGRWG